MTGSTCWRCRAGWSRWSSPAPAAPAGWSGRPRPGSGRPAGTAARRGSPGGSAGRAGRGRGRVAGRPPRHGLRRAADRGNRGPAVRRHRPATAGGLHGRRDQRAPGRVRQRVSQPRYTCPGLARPGHGPGGAGTTVLPPGAVLLLYHGRPQSRAGRPPAGDDLPAGTALRPGTARPGVAVRRRTALPEPPRGRPARPRPCWPTGRWATPLTWPTRWGRRYWPRSPPAGARGRPPCSPRTGRRPGGSGRWTCPPTRWRSAGCGPGSRLAPRTGGLGVRPNRHESPSGRPP